MSNLSIGIPSAAQPLLDAIATCTELTVWTRNPDGSPATYVHPDGKVVFQGVVKPGDRRPDGSAWVGEKPMYLIVYHHPLNKRGMCDAHWFEMDVLEAEVKEDEERSK